MAGLLEGKVVIVSGVGPGLGRSLVMTSAAHGAAVLLVARNEERLSGIASEVVAAGGRAEIAVADITDESSCRDVAAAALRSFGRIDGLCNNAFQQPNFENLEDQHLDDIRRSFEINTFAPLSLSRAVAPAMREVGGGSIVMTLSSILRRPRNFFGAYKMNKHALLGLARSLALEFGPGGIRVNSIAPGYIYDEPVRMYFQMLAADQGRSAEDVEAEITAEHALNHIPTPDEISRAAVFFLSDLAAAVTGQCLDVNGGEHMV